jgi:hypothetical protein
VSVAGAAETGKVKITLAFDEWKAGKVAPATFELRLPVKADESKK